MQKTSAKGLAIGVGAGVATAGIGLIEQAASRVVGVLGDANAAALEEEASIAKLGTALKANVPAWDGNTTAIERTLNARMKLGFSDDEQRDSLAHLVAATGDVNKALAEQQTAMDLARFKGISLAEATDALTKVEGGSFRILKGLGIELKAGATQQDALNAVQKVAAGQAEDYANTNKGKLLVSQVKVNEAMEKLGAVTMPAVTAAMGAAADAAGPVVDVLTGIATTAEQAAAALDHLAGADKHGGDETDALGSKTDALGTALHGLADLTVAEFLNLQDLADGGHRVQTYLSAAATEARRVGPAFSDMGTHAGKAADDVALVGKNAGKAKDDVVRAGGGMATAMGGIKTASHTMRRGVVKDLGDVVDAFNTAWDTAKADAQNAADDIFGPVERRAALAKNTLEQSLLKGEVTSGRKRDDKGNFTETQTEFQNRIAGARADLLGLQKDYLTLMLEMDARGELSADGVKKVSDALKDELKTASAEEAASILKLLPLIDSVAAKVNAKFLRTGQMPTGDRTSGAGYSGTRASGGPVWPGTWLVGEHGPETLHMGGSGTITPGVSAGSSDASAQWLPVIAGQLAKLTANEPAAARPQTARGQLARDAAFMPGGRL